MLTSRQLWCWVDSNWSLVRLYAYYIPIWICIFGSIIIYVAVGYRVFHQRNRLRNFAIVIPPRNKRANSGAASDAGDSAVEVSSCRTASTDGRNILTHCAEPHEET